MNADSCNVAGIDRATCDAETEAGEGAGGQDADEMTPHRAMAIRCLLAQAELLARRRWMCACGAAVSWLSEVCGACGVGTLWEEKDAQDRGETTG